MVKKEIVKAPPRIVIEAKTPKEIELRAAFMEKVHREGFTVRGIILKWIRKYLSRP